MLLTWFYAMAHSPKVASKLAEKGKLPLLVLATASEI